MHVLLIVTGGIVGLWIGSVDEAFLGMVGGAVLGFLFWRYLAVRKILQTLKMRVDALAAAAKPVADKPPVGARLAGEPRTGEPLTGEPPVGARPAGEPPTGEPLTGEPPVGARPAGEPPGATAPPPRPAVATRDVEQPVKVSPHAAQRPQPLMPTGIEKLLNLAKEWITTGNVPVKIGVIVSFFGVGFLLKYAVEQQYFVIPLELRYLGVAIGAGVLLTVGWRLREKARVYALSLQGGGIGILYLTIFAAFRLHPLLPAGLAFFLLVALTVCVGILAVLQDAKALAVLGSVGGFLAPVLVSTGSGNHIALFSYYLLLNAAILGIAWYKAWRVLNVLGFVFTFGVGTMWGYRYYVPEKFASTEPFLVAYFLFYQAIAILFAFRQPPQLRGLVDGTLIFGTPVIAFALQSQLVEGTEYGLATSAISLAVFYTLVALWLHRSQGKQMRLLVESYIALGVAFATIAIPLALDDRWTATAWALEGAALVWVGVRQQGMLARLTGTVLLFAGGAAYIKYGWSHDAGMPVLNGNVVGGLLISAASLFSARYLAADKTPMRGQALLSVPLLLWGLGWWGSTGSMEILDRGPSNAKLNLFIAFISISVGLLAWIARRYDWTAARRATLAYLPILPVVAILYIWEHDHLFRGVGTIAWSVAVVAHFGLLRAYDNGRGRVEGIWHFAGALMLVAFIGYEAGWRLDEAGFSDVWAGSTVILVLALAATAIIFAHNRLAWPLQRYWNAYLAAAGILISVELLLVMTAGIDNPGYPAPLPYVPLLNPFDVLTIIGLVIGLKFVVAAKATSDWMRGDQYRVAMILWGLAAFILSTIAVVRGVHHFGGVPWRNHALTNSVLVQSVLSIYWGSLGFAGMILGARRASRWIWLGGTALMTLVVLKLFTVDLGNTGTVARIVSFLGVGALLLVVGYYAPAPPRQAADVEQPVEG